MLREWLAVAVGGLVGTVLRHGTVGLFAIIGNSWMPVATLVVNLVGCFAIGYLAQWSSAQNLTNHWWVVGLRAGVLGGLTTFSSFGLDVVRLWQTARPEVAIGLAAAHVLLGIGAVVAGMHWAST
ncbi:MAG: CrcB family protein [Pirellulaceae bacterium]|nr:CrcB family protein [Pirellulaceae bacterium]